MLGKTRSKVWNIEKYHSGNVCVGVARGLAAIGLSQLPNKSGSEKRKGDRDIEAIIETKESVKDKGKEGIIDGEQLLNSGLAPEKECKGKGWTKSKLIIKRPIDMCNTKIRVIIRLEEHRIIAAITGAGPLDGSMGEE